jgi:hypothetical protein
MDFKSFIFADSKKESKQPEKTEKVEKSESTQKTFKSNFPTSDVGKPFEPTTYTQKEVVAPITPDNLSCEPHLDKIMKMYEAGFDSMNQEGYDFYEFFKAIVSNGIDNKMAYTMALNMASSMDSNVTKQFLLTQSQYYVTEINKVHSHYREEGTAKMEEAKTDKANEESSLRSEISDIKAELVRLNNLKEQAESTLASIDMKYTPKITEITCKVMANNMAKDGIISSIQQVVDGINKHL